MGDVSRRQLLAAGAVAVLVPALPSLAQPARGETPRVMLALESGWRFHLGHGSDPALDFEFGASHDSYAKPGDMGTEIEKSSFDDRAWQAVELPHDWAVDLPFTSFGPVGSEADKIGAFQGFKPLGRSFPATSVGWYRLKLPIEAADAGRRLSLEFDGVSRNCLVILNGFAVGGNESAYAPFSIDITDFAKPGEDNILLVRCDVGLGEAWSYEGAGLYRQIRLVKTAPVRIRQWGVAVRCRVEDGAAQIAIETEIDNQGPAATARMRSMIVSPDGRTLVSLLSEPFALPAWGPFSCAQETRLDRPALWSLETPALHRLVSELLIDGAVVDRDETGFGIRTIHFDPDKGMFLNGAPVKVKGTCNHQDHAGVGFAVPDSLHVWRLEQLKRMGANAYRSTHHPAPPAVLDACDRLGILVLEETRHMSSDPEGMSQLDRMVRRGRNHPSIFLWGVGNEEIHRGTETGAHIVETMKRRVYALDGTRPVTEALNGQYGKGSSRVLDVLGCNYHLDDIDAFHADHPTVPMIGTETASTVMTRGDYFRDDAAGLVPAYDTDFPPWASTAEQWWTFYAARPFLAGGFVWTGLDYRGEPTPFERWPNHSSNFGILDTCGFPKDNYWYYRAWWRAEPVLHLFPHWTWPGREGQSIAVWVHANCRSVELFLNGRSLGRKPVERYRHLEWQVAYEPGQIEARGYDDADRQILMDRRETAGAPAMISLTSDRLRLGEGDVAVVRAAILDAKQREVPNAADLVQFTVTGGARLLGVGNGDPRSLEPDHADCRHAFNGLCAAIVQARGTSPIHLHAQASGLRGATISLTERI